MWVISPQPQLGGPNNTTLEDPRNLGFVESQPEKSTKRDSMSCEPLQGITHAYNTTTNLKGERQRKCNGLCWLEEKKTVSEDGMTKPAGKVPEQKPQQRRPLTGGGRTKVTSKPESGRQNLRRPKSQW